MVSKKKNGIKAQRAKKKRQAELKAKVQQGQKVRWDEINTPPKPRPSRKVSKSDVIREVRRKARETEGYYKLLDELGEGAVKEKVKKVQI